LVIGDRDWWGKFADLGGKSENRRAKLMFMELSL
jgi:hypothetical protein